MSTHARSATNNVTYHWLGKQLINILFTPYIWRNTNVLCSHRFKIHINVKDNSGNTTLVLFNGVAKKLLDTSAHKLVNRLSKSESNIPPQIQSLCGMELVFKLKLSSFNLKEGLENYTVTKVYVPDEELELQHRINKEKGLRYTVWIFCQIRTLLIVNQSSSIPSIQLKPSLIIGMVFTVQGK